MYRIHIVKIKFICLILFISFFQLDPIMAYEEPIYEILESQNNYELRQYSPQIIAEVILEGEFQEVDNTGFFILADYIKGKNNKNQSISMTAPVNKKKSDDGKWSITFFMPSKYKLNDLPEPKDPRIKFKKIDGILIASLSYSGSWNKEKYENKKIELENIINDKDLKIVGEPIFARYNSPFMPWFLRRNEILIPVEEIEKN